MILVQFDSQGIPKESWDALLRPEESPFMEHDWLRAMEESKCATIDSGDCRGISLLQLSRAGTPLLHSTWSSLYRGNQCIWSVGVACVRGFTC